MFVNCHLWRVVDTDLFHPDLHLTHWGRVTHICVGKLIIIGSDNGLSPYRRQAIIWINAGLLPIGPLRTYFSENLIKMQQFSLKKMHVKMSAKWCLSCLGLNVLTHWSLDDVVLILYVLSVLMITFVIISIAIAFRWIEHRADSRLAPSQWETSLQSNTVYHWLGANLESALLQDPTGD